MKCVTVTLLLLAAAGSISAGRSRHARESSGSYSGSINGQHYGGSYRTPDNGPTTFNHYGDDAARSAGVLPFGGRIGFNDGFGSPVSLFSTHTVASPFQKRILDLEKLAWDAPQASASASGSIGPGGGHQSVNIYPENAASPNINTRFPSDGPQTGGFYEVSSSSSSSYSNVNGKPVYKKKAQTTVNDNGKVTTYVASD